MYCAIFKQYDLGSTTIRNEMNALRNPYKKVMEIKSTERDFKKMEN